MGVSMHIYAYLCVFIKWAQMNISINGTIRQLDSENMTISALVVTLNLTGQRLAIEKNGEIVPRSQFDAVNLQDGDKLEIVGAVGGG